MPNMNTRRDFLNLAAKGSAMVAASALIPAASAQGSTASLNSAASMNSKASMSSPQSYAATTSTDHHFKPRFKFGIGGVPLGNEFAVITDEDAHSTYNAAWEAGVRYFDVAPWYGLGLAERRLGAFVHTKDRDEYVLSTKVGKLLKASPTARQRNLFPFSPSPNDVVFDYTASGVRRSIEDSLQRLGIDRIDIAFVHDISSDNKILPMPWQDAMKIAIKGAFPELTRMREEGIIKGWGIGVNTPEPILATLENADPDVCLLASQYSLVDHKNALDQIFPAIRRKNASLVIGSSLNAGFLAGAPRYNYGSDSYKISPAHIEKRRQLHAVAGKYGVDLRTAALQFSAAPDVAAALVVGASSQSQILADYTSMQTRIPAEFWSDLKSQNLIELNAPTPTNT